MSEPLEIASEPLNRNFYLLAGVIAISGFVLFFEGRKMRKADEKLEEFLKQDETRM